MTIDDIERECRSWMSAEPLARGDNLNFRVTRLSEFILRALPVLRAADAWEQVNTGMHTNGPQHTLAMRDTRKALVDALDAFRRGEK